MYSLKVSKTKNFSKPTVFRSYFNGHNLLFAKTKTSTAEAPAQAVREVDSFNNNNNNNTIYIAPNIHIQRNVQWRRRVKCYAMYAGFF